MNRFGVYYRALNNLDSAKFFFNKVVSSQDTPYNRINKFDSYIELAGISARLKDPDKTKYFLDQALKYRNKSDSSLSDLSLEQISISTHF